jgi:MFS family permease
MSSVAAVAFTTPQTSEFRQGWSVVLACFCAATFAWGFGFYGQSVYFADLHAMRGWPASLIASATTVYYLAGAVLLTRVHRAIELLGSRLLLASGSVILGAGAIGLSRVQAPWQLYLCDLVMAVGWAATTTTAIATTLAQWFDRRRGLALSLALNGASAGGFTVAPLLVLCIHRMGMAHAVPILVMAGLAIVLPVVLLGIRGAPFDSQFAPLRDRGDAARTDLDRTDLDRTDTDRRTVFTTQAQALRSLHFWSVSLPFALALAAQVGFIVHQVAFLLPRLGDQGAGNAIAATAIAAAAGRLGFAPLIDRLNQRVASAASFTSQAFGLGLMVVLPDQPAALYIGSVVFGLSVGNVITLPALIVQREFAAQSFGLVIGLTSMVGQATMAFGPTLLGLAHDVGGGYSAALGLCIVLQLVGAVIVLVPPRIGAPTVC